MFFSLCIYFSAILNIASGDYPWWFAIGPALILVITDASKNLALMQMFLHTFRAAYSTQTALIGAVYDKVRLKTASERLFYAHYIFRCYVCRRARKQIPAAALSSIILTVIKTLKNISAQSHNFLQLTF